MEPEPITDGCFDNPMCNGVMECSICGISLNDAGSMVHCKLSGCHLKLCIKHIDDHYKDCCVHKWEFEGRYQCGTDYYVCEKCGLVRQEK